PPQPARAIGFGTSSTQFGRGLEGHAFHRKGAAVARRGGGTSHPSHGCRFVVFVRALVRLVAEPGAPAAQRADVLGALDDTRRLDRGEAEPAADVLESSELE